MRGCGGPAGPLRCWRCLPVVVGGPVDSPPLPAVAESSSPAPGSGPGSGPILVGLPGCPGPVPGPASPGRCQRWALGPAAGPGLPVLPPALALLLLASRNLRPPIHVPIRPKRLKMGRGGSEVLRCSHTLPDDSSCPPLPMASQGPSPPSPLRTPPLTVPASHVILSWSGDTEAWIKYTECTSGRLCVKYFLYTAYIIHTRPCKVGATRHTHISHLVPGHSSGRWQSQESRPRRWLPKFPPTAFMSF